MCCGITEAGYREVPQSPAGRSPISAAITPGTQNTAHDPGLARAFFTGYRNRRTLQPGYADRFRLHMLRDNLTGWEYGHGQATWFTPEQTFRPWSENYLLGALEALG